MRNYSRLKGGQGRLASNRHSLVALPSAVVWRYAPKATLDLSELRAFGRLADSWKLPCIDRWGVILPQRGVTHSFLPTGEPAHDGQGSGSEEAGSTTGSGERRRAPAETGTAAYPLESRLAELLGLDEVAWYHPDARWSTTDSSPRFLVVPIRLFGSLPYRATLSLEVPTTWDEWRSRWRFGRDLAPPIRAWAWWDDGIRVRSHHENPDTGICACKAEDWGLGRPLEDYISFCICWVAKGLHMQLLGRWPGPQHHPEWSRVVRDEPDEFCGCGSHQRYGVCHRETDFAVPFAYHMFEHWRVRFAYDSVLEARGLEIRPRTCFWSRMATIAPDAGD